MTEGCQPSRKNHFNRKEGAWQR